MIETRHKAQIAIEDLQDVKGSTVIAWCPDKQKEIQMHWSILETRHIRPEMFIEYKVIRRVNGEQLPPWVCSDLQTTIDHYNKI